ncbi:hypothetical protein Z517_00947 [Fonsecaea pedrosoi CBS 271.37]|uniref:Unplaced genomic scaffold supercont1.1, whole genome shotgun sequence n=1 Tax=Fonsecaea pedrosoi CBS 271.37 TaxID=1442368 RepID=A0A0D2H3V7_9EURO|nr:uncharacterized protein Z517_00947 [Fonsecaea pedrosoi CBS 271.37]KIW85555.1 hypothetical protein Z517_00947 [Fonsecaea pedrosoi CBS 271.37]
MNCPSRTDDVELEHPTWNQNPPDLAADLTTRQDLNGIANSREHKAACDDDRVNGLPPTVKTCLFDRPPDALIPAASTARLPYGLASLPKTVAAGDGRHRLPPPPSTPAPAVSALWSWTTWGLSVAVTSFSFSVIGQTYHGYLGRFSEGPARAYTSNSLAASTLSVRKRSTCPDDSANEDLYNTPLHVGALFIILLVSTLACSFAMLASRFPGLRLPAHFFFVIRHFGTGVLIATAFVHLLPTAFISLGDPCLTGFWNDDYPAMPGAIALAGIFLVILVEMIFHPCRRIRPRPEGHPTGDHALTDTSHGNPSQTDPTGPLRDMGPLVGKQSSIGRSLSRVNDARDVDQIEEMNSSKVNARPSSHGEHDGTSAEPMRTLTRDQKLRKARLQCVLLEIETFEGLALGSRIADIDWPMGTWQPWFMALAYGCTTPLGQAIGLATHSLYSPSSETGLLLVGTMNAISAGLLTFASLVELLSEDFLSDHSWDVLRGKSRVFASLLVFAGAFAMSLVGAWA